MWVLFFFTFMAYGKKKVKTKGTKKK